MVEEDAHCMDILHQTLAIQRAIGKLKRELRHAYLKACTTEALREKNNQKRERILHELLDVFKVSTKP